MTEVNAAWRDISFIPRVCALIKNLVELLKFTYFEKTAKMWRDLLLLFEISYYAHPSEIFWRFCHIFVALWEYMNFTWKGLRLKIFISNMYNVIKRCCGRVKFCSVRKCHQNCIPRQCLKKKSQNSSRIPASVEFSELHCC